MTQFNQKPSYEMYPTVAAPQVQQGSGGNAIIGALMKGLGQNKRSGNSNHYAKALLNWATGANPGTGVATPLTGGVEAAAGIGQTAADASTGLSLASAGTNASMDIAAGTGAQDFGAGGYLDQSGRALDTGFGDSGSGGGLRVSDNGPGMTVSDQNSVQYSPASEGGTGTASTGGQEASSNGSYTGAVTGALSGMAAGERNYYNDPNMTNKRDGFGTKHPDYRAGVGGGSVGGLVGYYGGGYANAAIPAIVDWLHPGMEQFTRGLIQTGHQMTGDSAGSMILDPIGSVASGKYSDTEIANDWAKYQPMPGGSWKPWEQSPEELGNDRAKMMLMGGLGRYIK